MAGARKATMRLAFCGVMTALGTVLMLMGGVIPIATYCVPMIAGLVLLAVLLEYGLRWGWMVWGCTALLTLLMGADKEAAFFYLFFGCYPMLKPYMEKLPKGLRLPAKALLFILITAVMYLLLCFVFPLEAVLAEFREGSLIFNIVLTAVIPLCMLLYDRLLTPMALLYVQRVHPRLKLLKRG